MVGKKLQIQLERMHLLYWQERVSEMRAVADAFEGAVSHHGTPLQQYNSQDASALPPGGIAPSTFPRMCRTGKTGGSGQCLCHRPFR